MLYAIVAVNSAVAVDLTYEQAHKMRNAIETQLHEHPGFFSVRQDTWNDTETPHPRFDGCSAKHFTGRFPEFVAGYKF